MKLRYWVLCRDMKAPILISVEDWVSFSHQLAECVFRYGPLTWVGEAT